MKLCLLAVAAAVSMANAAYGQTRFSCPEAIETGHPPEKPVEV
jgi:hypothetical protein